MSWVAYVWPGLKYGLVILLVGLVDWLPWWIGALAAARLAYKVAYIHATEVSLDDDGVWLSRGILPWSKGTAGVKWRDLDQATFYLGMIPWLTGSHTVRVVHRFTKEAEIVVPHVANAKELVNAIAGEHKHLATTGALA